LLSKVGEVTGRRTKEYAEAIWGRYFRAPNKVKTKILNEFVAVIGLYRKAAIRLLNRRNRPPWRKRGGVQNYVILK
ncbi:hypothetical protein ACFLYL_04915, partial [Chloroflexota bacterium]